MKKNLLHLVSPTLFNRYAADAVLVILCHLGPVTVNAQTTYWLTSLTAAVNKQAVSTVPATASPTKLATPGIPLYIFEDDRNGYIYYSDAGNGTISRISTAGGAITTVVSGISGTGVYPRGIYVDITNNMLYWAQTATGAADVVMKVSMVSLPRAASNGTKIVTGINIVRGITVDTVGNYVYFADAGNAGIYRTSTSSNAVSEASTTKMVNLSAGSQPGSLALDNANGILYWSDYSPAGKILTSSTLFTNNTPSTAYTGNSAIRGLELDTRKNTIYWTEYPSLRVVKATASAANISNFAPFITGLSGFPRDVAVSNHIIWTGGTSTAWATGTNWNLQFVPTATDDVDIPSGTTYSPLISTAVSADNMYIFPNASLTISAVGTLTTSGNIDVGGSFNNNSQTGGLVLNGTTLQTITGAVNINNLTLNNNAGATLASGATTVYGIYAPTAGTLSSNGNLVLASNAANTANVAAGTGNNYITGNVVVQRYIPGRRAWRYLTAPLSNSGSIFSNWQNNGVVNGTTGVEIWSPSGTGPTGNGLLQGGVSASAEILDPYVYNGSGGSFVSLTNTKTLDLDTTTSSGANKAFSIFVTGPYGSGRIAGTAGDDATTTLVATGLLQMGTQTFNYSGIPAGNDIMVGNPYACPVNFTNISGNSTNIDNIMWTWDPQRLNTSEGGYVTFTWDSHTNSYDQVPDASQTAQTTVIQSGQAVLLQADTVNFTKGTLENVSIVFKETDKSVGNNTNQVFGVTIPSSQVRLSLNRQIGGSMQPVDGALVKFDNSYSPGISDDANKLYNFDENLALRIAGNYLAVERRPNPQLADTLFLDVYGLKKNTNYSFTIQPQNINLGEGLQPYLFDKYLNTVTPVSFTGSSTASFTTTDIAGSLDETRFSIVFSSTALATTFTSVKAAPLNKGIQVQWSVATELGINNYIVEKSADGITFNDANTTAAINNNQNQSYGWFDAAPYDGSNYYRIKAVNKDGSSFYSNVVLVNIKLALSFLAYPNPLPHNEQLKIDIGSMAAGKYTLQIFTADGKKVVERAITSDGNASTNLLNMPSIAAGVYQAVLTDENGKTWKQKLIVE